MNENPSVVANTVALQRRLLNSKRCLVILTAAWCGHCKSMAPEIEKVKEYITKHTKGVDCEQIDESTVDRKLLAGYKITGFPTILLISEGRMLSQFNGERSASSIINYAIASAIF